MVYVIVWLSMARFGLSGMTWYILWHGEVWHGIWYDLVGMAWYMIWPCGHGMVYGMAW